MILEKQKEANVLADGEAQGSTKMSLDLDSAQILMQMLSKNLYSDSIGSTVRECASNALDSHRRAGVDKPIIVSFGRNNSDNYEFSVEDFGIGLDADDVENIISKYGKSTKRDSNTELGMMGLGFKAPLAYTSSFYFVCRKGGMERKYMMYEGEDVNTIDLLYETPTTEDNGVKVIVPVKWQDNYDFIQKIKEQLAYFDSVYFNVNGISNEYLIHRSENFQFSELGYDSNLHICLDNVYYPIDFNKLGIPNINIPVALRFTLTDGLFPTPNRESIRYTQESKQVILNKLAKFADYVADKYNESVTDSADLKAIFRYYENSTKTVQMCDRTFNVTDLLQYASVQIKEPQLKNIQLLSLKKMTKLKNYLLGEYRIKYTIYRNTMREYKSYWSELSNIYNTNATHYYIYDNVIGGNKKLYMKSILPQAETFYFVKKVKTFPLGNAASKDYTSYYEILSLGAHPKSEWRDRIKEFQYMVSLLTKDFKDLDVIDIPQSWFDARKKATGVVTKAGRRLKLEGEVVGKQACNLERYVDGKNCKFVPDTFKLADFAKKKCLTVYSSHDSAKDMDPLYHIANGKQKMEFITFSQRELNVLDKVEIHNLIPYSKFMEGKNKPFKRLVTAYLISRLMHENKHLFAKKHKLETVSTMFLDKLKTLEQYCNTNYYNSHDEIFTAMLVVATEHNLFDMSIYPLYQEVKATCDKLKFLEPLMTTLAPNSYTDDSKLIDAMADLFKYYRFRLDYTRYNLRLNDEAVPTEEVLSEETVEELVQ